MDVYSIFRYGGLLLILIGVFLFFYSKKKTAGGLPSISLGGGGHTKNLDTFAVDITRLAPVVGREKEIMRLTQILTRRTKNNVVLVGSPGVGKTAIVEGLAVRIVHGEVPGVLANKRVLSLRVAELLAGTKYRGEFEQRIKGLIDDIRTSNRTIILFVDEIHTVMQAKGTEGSINLADILKPALARGDLQLIGATTQKEYEQYIQPDETWDRRFQRVFVDEPTIDEAITILHGIKKNYEEYHKIQFTDDAIDAAVRLSEEYISGRQLPDKAIDLIDEAAAMVNVHEGTNPHHTGLIHAAAGKFSGKVVGGGIPGEASGQIPEAIPTVTRDDIKEVVAEWAGLPVTEIH